MARKGVALFHGNGVRRNVGLEIDEEMGRRAVGREYGRRLQSEWSRGKDRDADRTGPRGVPETRQRRRYLARAPRDFRRRLDRALRPVRSSRRRESCRRRMRLAGCGDRDCSDATVSGGTTASSYVGLTEQEAVARDTAISARSTRHAQKSVSSPNFSCFRPPSTPRSTQGFSKPGSADRALEFSDK